MMCMMMSVMPNARSSLSFISFALARIPSVQMVIFWLPAAWTGGPGGTAKYLGPGATMMQPASLCLEACRSLSLHPGGMASTGGVPSGKVSSFNDPRVVFSLAIIGKER